MDPTTQVFTGVDYARYTATDHEPFEHWAAIIRPEFVREELKGRKPHDRWLLGYYGRVGEHVFIGKNEGGCMCQVSGAFAWRHWRALSVLSPRCTRLDLQVTWPIEGEPGDYIREMYGIGQLAKPKNGRPPELQITDTPKGAKMLTVGNRQSLLYGRMYDKFRESGIPEYKGCVRWEIEVKAESAQDLKDHLTYTKDEPYVVRAIVRDFWDRRGMTPFWDTFEGMEGTPPTRRTRTDDTKIAWLATQVNSTLRALQNRGKIVVALRGLLSGLVSDEELEEILKRFVQDSAD